jgi:hypothetical protein
VVNTRRRHIRHWGFSRTGQRRQARDDLGEKAGHPVQLHVVGVHALVEVRNGGRGSRDVAVNHGRRRRRGRQRQAGGRGVRRRTKRKLLVERTLDAGELARDITEAVAQGLNAVKAELESSNPGLP